MTKMKPNPKKIKVTPKEFYLLYLLLNYHLNTIGEIAINLPIPRLKKPKRTYMRELEDLESKLSKLMDISDGLKQHLT